MGLNAKRFSYQRSKLRGSTLDDMGHDRRFSLEYVPARYVKRTVRIHKYACRACERAVRSQKAVRADAESSLIPGSFTSSSIVAHIMADEFLAPPYDIMLEELVTSCGVYPDSRPTSC